MKRLLLAVALISVGCGSVTPSSPAPQPTPVPTPQPLAASLIDVTGAGTVTVQPDGTYAVGGSGRNVGTGCAGTVSGIVDASDRTTGQQLASMPWSLPTTQIVRPDEVFTFTSCCLGSQYAGANVSGKTRYSFTTVPCS